MILTLDDSHSLLALPSDSAITFSFTFTHSNCLIIHYWVSYKFQNLDSRWQLVLLIWDF